MPNQFLTNYTETTFLEKIKDNLRHCSSFDFSVSFIKRAGLVLLYKDIEAAVERGAKGRIITSTYQNFTDIESLKSFFALQNRCINFECHLDYECFHDNGYSTLGYHSKGYLFDFNGQKEIIVGSSNITRYALLKNIEWDVVLQDDSVYTEAMAEFVEKWQATHSLNQDILNLYANKLNFAIERWDMDYDLSAANIKPNFMQRKALKELNRYRAVGTNRALVVAAAGSGKTCLAAFDALNFNPKRLLYIVHEGSILRKSLETFQDVFGGNVTYGVYDGKSKEFDADFLFSTNVTMAKAIKETPQLFPKDCFDYIIVDECHHATAETYKNIIGYFEPEFLLGLTATPERMDNEDVFELFDKNVPYELRLRDAIIKQDFFNFKNYINSNTYPTHMDYLNNDCAPDFLRFLTLKNSYYLFLEYVLTDLNEANYLPVFSDEQKDLLEHLSKMLPLVREYEFLIFKYLIDAPKTKSELSETLSQEIQNFDVEKFEHALKFINYKDNDFVAFCDKKYTLNIELNLEFQVHILDLIKYGLTRYNTEHTTDTTFSLWSNYYTKEIQRLLLRTPATYQKGTEFINDFVYIFAELKKDLDDANRRNYKNKYLSASTFQWETEADISDNDYKKLCDSKQVCLFVRKVKVENGITMPYIYCGIGKLTNSRQQNKTDQTGNSYITYLFDVKMENELPDYLQYDFGLNK